MSMTHILHSMNWRIFRVFSQKCLHVGERLRTKNWAAGLKCDNFYRKSRDPREWFETIAYLSDAIVQTNDPFRVCSTKIVYNVNSGGSFQWTWHGNRIEIISIFVWIKRRWSRRHNGRVTKGAFSPAFRWTQVVQKLLCVLEWNSCTKGRLQIKFDRVYQENECENLIHEMRKQRKAYSKMAFRKFPHKKITNLKITISRPNFPLALQSTKQKDDLSLTIMFIEMFYKNENHNRTNEKTTSSNKRKS